MGVGLGVNDVPIVGEPVAFGAGFLALLVRVLLGVHRAVLRHVYAHEGGHVLDARRASHDRSPGSELEDERRWAGRLVVGKWRHGSSASSSSIVGYAAPPLLGLAAAALIAVGNPWAVLLAAIVLSSSPWSRRETALAFIIPLLVVLGLGAALLYGSGELAGRIRGRPSSCGSS